MELTIYQITLISGGFGIAGTLLGTLASYRLALKLAEKQFDISIRLIKVTEFKAASRALTQSFAKQLATIRPVKNISVSNMQMIIEPSIKEMAVEMEKVRFFLSTNNLAAYDAACKEYQAIAKIGAVDIQAINIEEPFHILENKVNKILEFTNDV